MASRTKAATVLSPAAALALSSSAVGSRITMVLWGSLSATLGLPRRGFGLALSLIFSISNN